MSKIEVQELVKRFGSNLVVDRISFEVKDGEFLVLLGPSGGGKSTILRLICGLEAPDSGQIILGGQDVTRLSPRQRNVGMVFQDYGLYPSMDVFGNIAYGLENRNLPKVEIQKRVAEAAEKLHLTPLLRRDIGGLSGGEQQRVALARILARDADIFLYDEPLANLDPKLRYQARRDILAVHKVRQVPSIYVTHEQSEAFAMGDRIAVIAHGKLQQVGTPDELLERPANLFMARFLGSPPMNLLEGTWSISDAGIAFQIQQQEDWSLPTKWRAALESLEHNELIAGCTPQSLVPPWQLPEDVADLCVFSAEVTDVEPLIGEIIVYLKLANGAALATLWPEPEESLPAAGAILRVGLNPGEISLFDPRTEQALETRYT